ncbi:MAG: bifunctional (p)ppGpp synthetase/guanosine-3',5'-bis(diphosphate) 3'-pyrophosphohydrolase [Rubrivivax sp.]|nr:bifunctional (p)ppGpp synthetase/guanosine-3',5'-bis(diphosphate) 3'-pyrophosphohydrolase [Rubrivivax sp.]
MKTRADPLPGAAPSAIVEATALVEPGPADTAPARSNAGAAARSGAGSAAAPPGPPADALAAARGFTQPLLTGRQLDTGEDAWAHAEGVASILASLGAAVPMQAAAYLVYAADFLQQPVDVIGRAFGPSYASLVELTRRLVAAQRAARNAAVEAEQRAQQTERVRKMLLAFSRDLRVVLLRLASRLQTLRWHAAARQPCPPVLARESLDVFAPLANRLGIWPIKWELEDLAFRLLDPASYHAVARRLDQTRAARELGVDFVRHQLAGELRRAGIEAEVAGRPKHLYSIWKKMQGKGLAFEQVLDVRALRVIVPDVPACYAALSAVHARYAPVPGEYDDYIARPKPNGYQSLHTVVRGDDGLPVEVQIRTAQMHAHAEHGVAAHWAYKEAGSKGYAGVSADGDTAARMAAARKAVMQQLLAWERDLSSQPGAPAAEDRIYVLTPQSTVVDLPAGATPVDFAYSLHTELGHRCRGARVDGALVPLNTALRNGQTVEIVATREGGPSLDWINPELGYLHSPRAKAKVRAWFNAQVQAQTIARGREAIERLLQREGRTAVKLDDLAARLGFKEADALFEVIGKDEFSLRQVEAVLRPPEPAPEAADEGVLLRRSKAGDSGVLVVGVESLLTNLARCCRPAPPDAIGGFVTRGKGVAIHRGDCSNFRHMAAQAPERTIPVAWGRPGADALYPVDVAVEALDRQGLLRDISEVFTRERVNVTGVKTQSVRDAGGDKAWMTFTVEVADAARLRQVLRLVAAVPGVRTARRR